VPCWCSISSAIWRWIPWLAVIQTVLLLFACVYVCVCVCVCVYVCVWVGSLVICFFFVLFCFLLASEWNTQLGVELEHTWRCIAKMLAVETVLWFLIIACVAGLLVAHDVLLFVYSNVSPRLGKYLRDRMDVASVDARLVARPSWSSRQNAT